MLLIPLIVMISLFAATKTISIMVDVPVSGITMSDSGAQLYLDMDKNETHSLEYTVYPTNAKNKTVSATAESVNGKELASLDFDISEGKVNIIPKSAGSARVFLTTNEGGYRASVTVHVESKKSRELQSITSELSKTELQIGEKATITTEFNPKNPSNSILHYSSDNESVATVNDRGEVFALRGGVANITVTSDYSENIFNVLTVTVYNKDTAEIITPPTFSSLANEGELPLPIPDSIGSIDPAKLTLRAITDGPDGEIDISSIISLELISKNGHYSISYKFTDSEYVGSYRIVATYEDEYNSFTAYSGELSKTVKELVNIELSFDSGNTFSAVATTDPNAFSAVFFSVSPSGLDLVYEVSTSNPGIVSGVKVSGSRLQFKPVAPGVANITLKAYLEDNHKSYTEETLTVFVSPSSGFTIVNPSIDAASQTVEGIFTLGKYEYGAKYNGASDIEAAKKASVDTTVYLTENTANRIILNYSFKNMATADPSFRENIRWEVEPRYSDMVAVDENGRIYFRDNTDSFDETVEFRAVFGMDGNTALATCNIRCVANGINVYSYLDLYRATAVDSNKRNVVLRSDIINDFGIYYDNSGKARHHYVEIHTTYDDVYYKNIGMENDAKVKVLIEFRKNVYGNGHTVNAHNLTIGLLDGTGATTNALFKGPLNLVAMSENNSKSAVSVKGQDNICFALYEGAKLSNVNLHGSSPDESGGLDLTDLDYAGTVVEVLGDNTSIEYSRIRYGRLAVRAFGDINDSEKVINLNIKNTRLSETREFILRIGSNRFINGSYENPSPNLSGAGNNTHMTAKSEYNTNFSDEQRKQYDSNYINTFVTLENCVFRNPGLFAIGVDSHFSSYALADGSKFTEEFTGMAAKFTKENGESYLASWKNLAKTSYGAKIKFVGEVNLYTWKPIDDVNSDTLIEKPQMASISVLENLANTIPDVRKFLDLITGLDFNVKKMLSSYNGKLQANNKIVYTDGSGSYVHGGIAFFGGGKNYGVFDTTEAIGDSKRLPSYPIGLDEVGSGYLTYAAGDEPFYFFMFNASTYKPNGDDSIINKKAN